MPKTVCEQARQFYIDGGIRNEGSLAGRREQWWNRGPELPRRRNVGGSSVLMMSLGKLPKLLTSHSLGRCMRYGSTNKMEDLKMMGEMKTVSKPRTSILQVMNG